LDEYRLDTILDICFFVMSNDEDRGLHGQDSCIRRNDKLLTMVISAPLHDLVSTVVLFEEDEESQ
jgi:hypothetical protein